MLVQRRLKELAPSYVKLGERERVGLSLRCPRSDERGHALSDGEPHFMTLWFRDPEDGQGPIEGVQAICWHQGALDDLAHFTLWTDDHLPLHVPGHWRGYIIEGVAYDALSWGPF